MGEGMVRGNVGMYSCMNYTATIGQCTRYGTTAYVARHHGRRAIGIELNAEYARLAADRLRQGVLGLEVY